MGFASKTPPKSKPAIKAIAKPAITRILFAILSSYVDLLSFRRIPRLLLRELPVNLPMQREPVPVTSNSESFKSLSSPLIGDAVEVGFRQVFGGHYGSQFTLRIKV